MAFTWILALLPVLQVLGQVISTEENLACGNLSPKHVFQLFPSSSELPNLTKFLNIVPSATFVIEDTGILRVFSDPKDWKTIYRYMFDRGFYFSHVARCVDKNEFSVSEQLYLPENSIDQNMIEGRRSGESGKNYAASERGTAASVAWKEGQISYFGGVKGAPEVPKSSVIEVVENEQRFRRLVRGTDAKSDDDKDESKKSSKKKVNKKKKGKVPRRRSSKRKVSKRGKKDDVSTTENSAAYKTTATKSRGGSKFYMSSKNVKTRRSLAESLEHERRSRATKKSDDDDDDYDENTISTTTENDVDDNTVKGKKIKKNNNNNNNNNKKGKTPSGKGSTKTPSGHKRPKNTEVPSKDKVFGCKKGGKSCKGSSDIVWLDDDGKHQPEETATDNPWYNEVDTDMDLVIANKVEYDRSADELRSQNCPPTVPAKPLGRLADYIYRIFSWVKNLESKKKGLKDQD